MHPGEDVLTNSHLLMPVLPHLHWLDARLRWLQRSSANIFPTFIQTLSIAASVDLAFVLMYATMSRSYWLVIGKLVCNGLETMQHGVGSTGAK
jgi:hypothetical protein